LEANATSIRSFQSQLIHGLLQTEDYARTVLDAFRPDNLDGLLAARMTRQLVLEKPDRPYAWFIMDEQVLRRKLGEPEMRRGQFERLLRAGEEPRTVIQVVPDKVPAHPGLEGPFTILSTDEGPDVLHVDGFSQGRFTADKAELGYATRAYDLLRSVALSHEDSAELIGKYLEEALNDQRKRSVHPVA
jgi:hypothetical protein